jgi:hypothetical protein
MQKLEDLAVSSTSDAMPRYRMRLRALVHPGFNLQMAYAGAGLLLIAFVGCPLTSIRIADPGTLALGLGAIAVLALPIVLYLHEKEKYYLRDSLLTVFWAFYFTLMLGFPVTLAARLGMHIPLQDLRFEQWDRWLGIHVSDIHAWALTHWFGVFAEKCYLQLFTFMQIAILLPIFTGRLKAAQSFIVANLVAFVVGLPFFALLPGIDPWYGDHFMAVPDAAMCKSFVLLAIREAGPYIYKYPAGAICFPSFHVIWAILCVYALWGYRYLRLPACLFGTLIVISTVTTGNHYVVDVLGGIAVTVAAIIIASRITRTITEHAPPSLRFWKM